MFVKEFFDDCYSKEKGGCIGFMIVFYFVGFYQLEYVVYSCFLNKVSMLICIGVGYYLFKVYECCLVCGEIEVVYILVWVKDDVDV